MERQRCNNRIGLLLILKGNGVTTGLVYSNVERQWCNNRLGLLLIWKGNGVTVGLAYS